MKIVLSRGQHEYEQHTRLHERADRQPHRLAMHRAEQVGVPVRLRRGLDPGSADLAHRTQARHQHRVHAMPPSQEGGAIQRWEAGDVPVLRQRAPEATGASRRSWLEVLFKSVQGEWVRAERASLQGEVGGQAGLREVSAMLGRSSDAASAGRRVCAVRAVRTS